MPLGYTRRIITPPAGAWVPFFTAAPALSRWPRVWIEDDLPVGLPGAFRFQNLRHLNLNNKSWMNAQNSTCAKADYLAEWPGVNPLFPLLECPMFATARKLRPILKTHGGKAYLARRIITLFPPHRNYVEPFAGGLSVLLNKPRAEGEVVGDLNGDLINVYRVLQDHTAELGRRLGALDYSEATFERAAVGEPLGAVDAAVRFLVRNRMSRGGLGSCFASSERLRGGRPGDLNAWLTILAELPRLADRLAGVELRHAPALELIWEYDGPETLFYIDPPYLHETRTARNIYRHEMTREQHAELLDVLAVCRGTVVLSGYANALYDRRLAGWQRQEIPIANHAGQGRQKQRRVEVVWCNR
jgi:DNA adenine methylase